VSSDRRAAVAAKVPKRHRWVFWDVDAGMEGIHRFLRDVGHPELSERTLRFWRAALKAKDETWASPPAWRKSSAAPWID